MMRQVKRELILSAQGLLTKSLRDVLLKDGYSVKEYHTEDELLSLVAPIERVGMILIPEDLGGMRGLEILSRLHRQHPRVPLVFVTSEMKSEILIEAVKRGAFDCLAMPLHRGDFLALVEEASEAGQRMQELVTVGNGGGDEHSLIGQSRKMMRLYRELGRLSATPVTVLIQGETGTGKELIARALYQHGHRAHQPFIAINCAAIPENLIESELFGHEKGAFTGAVQARVGKFEQAHGATLFLDEIGDLDLSLQAKLLRVLQERQIQRVGGRELIPVDARLIAATHQNLEAMIAEGTFREDLFYRLNVANIQLPPLREREGDVQLLVEHFLTQFGNELGLEAPSLTQGAMKMLEAYPWPGNVRQLQNVIRKALLEGRSFGIDEKTVTPLLANHPKREMAQCDRLEQLITDLLGAAERGETRSVYADLMTTLERELFSKIIVQTHGNQAKAARWLGITRSTLREKLARYGLRKPAE